MAKNVYSVYFSPKQASLCYKAMRKVLGENGDILTFMQQAAVQMALAILDGGAPKMLQGVESAKKPEETFVPFYPNELWAKMKRILERVDQAEIEDLVLRCDEEEGWNPKLVLEILNGTLVPDWFERWTAVGSERVYVRLLTTVSDTAGPIMLEGDLA